MKNIKPDSITFILSSYFFAILINNITIVRTVIAWSNSVLCCGVIIWCDILPCHEECFCFNPAALVWARCEAPAISRCSGYGVGEARHGTVRSGRSAICKSLFPAWDPDPDPTQSRADRALERLSHAVNFSALYHVKLPPAPTQR